MAWFLISKNTPGGSQTRRGCRARGTHTQERVWNHQAGAGRWELWQKGGQPLEELVLVGLPLGHAPLGAGQEGRGQGGALLLPGGEEADRAGRGIRQRDAPDPQAGGEQVGQDQRRQDGVPQPPLHHGQDGPVLLGLKVQQQVPVQLLEELPLGVALVKALVGGQEVPRLVQVLEGDFPPPGQGVVRGHHQVVGLCVQRNHVQPWRTFTGKKAQSIRCCFTPSSPSK